jgi:hypothetical protein
VLGAATLLPAVLHASGASVVRVYVAGPPQALARTRATLSELFARIRIDVVVEPAEDDAALAGASKDSVARAFFDFRALSAPRVVLAPGTSGHELERRTLPGSASLEVSIEEASHVLYLAVESALEAREGSSPATDVPLESPGGAAPGTAPAAAATAAPPAAATSEPPAAVPSRPAPAAKPVEQPSPTRVEADAGARPRSGSHAPPIAFEAGVSAFGAVSSFAAEHVLPGVGGAVDVAFGTAPLRGVALLSFGEFLPSDVIHDTRSGSLHAESVRLLGGVEWLPFTHAPVGFVLAGGGGVDRVTFEPGPSSATVLSSAVASRADPIVEGMAGARFRVSRSFAMFALSSLDVDLTPHRYTAEANGQTSTFFSLPAVRPAALLGVTYVFLDAPERSQKDASR